MNLGNIFWNFAEANAGEFVTGAFGAFFGALAAFGFERWKDRRDQQESQYSALIRAQMVLILNINSLHGVKRTHLDPYRDLSDREFKMPYFYQIRNSESVKMDSLSFLVDAEGADLVAEIHFAHLGYHNSFDSIQLRNDALKEFQAAGTIHGMNVQTGEHIFQCSDLGKAKLLCDATASVFNCNARAILDNETALHRLTAKAKHLFPKRKMLRFELEPIEARNS